MGKVCKPRKVFTPGSHPATPQGKAKRGRPAKAKKSGRTGKYRIKYDEETLQQAVAEVKAKRMTIREAAKAFNIPRSSGSFKNKF